MLSKLFHHLQESRHEPLLVALRTFFISVRDGAFNRPGVHFRNVLRASFPEFFSSGFDFDRAGSLVDAIIRNNEARLLLDDLAAFHTHDQDEQKQNAKDVSSSLSFDAARPTHAVQIGKRETSSMSTLTHDSPSKSGESKKEEHSVASDPVAPMNVNPAPATTSEAVSAPAAISSPSTVTTDATAGDSGGVSTTSGGAVMHHQSAGHSWATLRSTLAQDRARSIPLAL